MTLDLEQVWNPADPREGDRLRQWLRSTDRIALNNVVLLADDLESGRPVADALVAGGFNHVLWVKSPDDAIAVIERGMVDLVITDINFEEGHAGGPEAGWEIVKAAKLQGPNPYVEVVVYTAHAALERQSQNSRAMGTLPAFHVAYRSNSRLENDALLRVARNAIRTTRNARRSDLLPSANLANLCHDLATPIQNVFLRLEASKMLDAVGRDQAINYVKGQLDNTMAFLRDHLKSGPRAEFRVNVGDVINDVLDELRAQQNGRTCELSTSVGRGTVGEVMTLSPLPRLSPSPKDTMIHSVIRNLVRNSVKYSERAVVAVEVAAEYLRSSDSIKISIKDNAGTLHKNALAKGGYRELFKPGVSTGSTGMGLPICQLYVDEHGGAMDVMCDPGVATTFAVWIPRAKP